MTRSVDECRAILRRLICDCPGRTTAELAADAKLRPRQALTDLRAIGAQSWWDGSATRWWPT